MASPDPILASIESFLERTGIGATTFGRKIAGDPHLVADLREGRELRRALREKIEQHIRDNSPEDGESSEASAA